MVLEKNTEVIRQRPQARALAQRVRGLRGPAEGTAGNDRPEIESPFSVKMVLYLKAHLDAGETHYTTRPGMVELRQRVADALAGFGAPARGPEAVLITAGEGEAVFASLLGLGYGPGDSARFSGRWRPHGRLLDMMGVTPLEEPLPEDEASESEAEAERGRLLPPPRSAKAAASPGESAKPAAAAEASGGPVPIVCLGDVFGTAAAELPDLARDAVYVGNLDGLPEMDMFGLGFVAGSPERIKRIMTWKQAFSICSPAPSQRAALLAFERWDERQAEAGS